MLNRFTTLNWHRLLENRLIVARIFERLVRSTYKLEQKERHITIGIADISRIV